jgi:hypothetical protein
MPGTDPVASPRRTMTIRLSVPQWRRVKELALEIDCSVQDLAVAGFNRMFAERGLELLDPESTLRPPAKKRQRRRRT